PFCVVPESSSHRRGWVSDFVNHELPLSKIDKRTFSVIYFTGIHCKHGHCEVERFYSGLWIGKEVFNQIKCKSFVFYLHTILRFPFYLGFSVYKVCFCMFIIIFFWEEQINVCIRWSTHEIIPYSAASYPYFYEP